MLPTFILFRHEQYNFQKDLGAQLKLSGDYDVYTLPALEIPLQRHIWSRVVSSVAHLSLHPEHIPEQPKHSLSSPREDS